MTKQAEEILSQKRSLESELESYEQKQENGDGDFSSEIRTLQNQLEEFHICDRCDGEGEVIAHERINSKTTDVPYKSCPICKGQGIK